ncbi:RES family NAD+ phosphorylase [Dyadobacter bucti]|uniref:RES family NAD+ phosphorylase n=1 Tax=Dyadobacter bucti TaxID=2572203 RepID=UPI001109D704|nr:RES family NAD+ phosphorylase [Dyadobacter bucti]
MPSRILPYISQLETPSALTNPVADVERILREMLDVIGKRMVLGQYRLHPGDVNRKIPFHEITRVRPHRTISETFITRESLSFKPQEFNTTFQRASTPDQTMFYGELKDHRTDSLPNRLTSTVEGVPWLREPGSSGKQKVTYSKWIVRENLMLFPVIFNSEYSGNPHVAALLMQTINFINDLNPEFADDIRGFYEYIAFEFAKMHVGSDDINYLVTALFTKIMIEKGAGRFDGILYPSCRVYGEGTNVAILPESTAKLDLVAAGECMIYKHGEHTIIDNLTVSNSDGQTPLVLFDYIPVSNEFKRGEQAVYDELGVSSLEYRF